MYFHCKTSLITEFKKRYPEFTFMGNRAIVFDVNDVLPIEKIKKCIFLSLTYNLRKEK